MPVDVLQVVDADDVREVANARRGAILQIEEILQQLPTRYDAPVHHMFAGVGQGRSHGVYARFWYGKAGSMHVSKIHRTQHFALIVSGDVSVADERGAKRYHGPELLITQPATKRMLVCHTDVLWVTFHATDTTDVDEIERQIIAPDFSEFSNDRVKEAVAVSEEEANA